MFDKNRCMNFDGADINMNINVDDYKMPAMDNNMAYMGSTMPGVSCPPIYECPRISYVNRTICHTVPHIIPCETRVINHHVYRHTYTPCYSMSESSTCENVYDTPCC